MWLSSFERLHLERQEKKGMEKLQKVQRKACKVVLVSLRVALESKFGSEGKKLMPVLRKISDLTRLERLAEALEQAKELEDFRQLLE